MEKHIIEVHICGTTKNKEEIIDEIKKFINEKYTDSFNVVTEKETQ